MSTSTPAESTMIVAKNYQFGKFGMTFQIRGVPPQFVNAIRRVLLNETPTVEVTDVQVLENTTLIPHEVLRHRTEMLPIDVKVSEEDVIRSAQLTLRVVSPDQTQDLTTKDFAVSGARSDILMRDRDLKTPLYFMKIKKGEAVHITARLTVNPKSSQVCVASYNIHVDEEKAEEEKEKHEDKGTFDVFHRQRIIHTNEKGRPDWFDFVIESLGVIPAKDLLVAAVNLLKERVSAWVKLSKDTVIRDSEPKTYRVVSTTEGHTVGALAQIVGYELPDTCSFISYDVPHPLRPEMVLRFRTEKSPEAVLDAIGRRIAEMCESTISSIDK